jgi:hypothetical protein
MRWLAALALPIGGALSAHLKGVEVSPHGDFWYHNSPQEGRKVSGQHRSLPAAEDQFAGVDPVADNAADLPTLVSLALLHTNN